MVGKNDRLLFMMTDKSRFFCAFFIFLLRFKNSAKKSWQNCWWGLYL